MGGKRAPVLALLLWGTQGCFEPSAEATKSLAQVREDGRRLERLIDGVEGRLLGNQAMLQQWAELSRRHQEVSAISCGNAAAHTAQIISLRERQLEKALRARQGRYAGREAGVGGPLR